MAPTASATTRRMPAEWEPQESVWLVWPRDPRTWPDRIEAARRAYLDAIEAITAGDPPQAVDLVVHPDLLGDTQAAVDAVAPPGSVRFHPVAHVDSWIRDYGPIYVLEGPVGGATPGGPSVRRVALKFRFDAWGGKYADLARDDDLVGRLDVRAPVEPVDFVLEGGAIDTDGEGTFLTTRQCMRHPNRGDRSEAQVEAVLRERLGARKVLWLDRGIQGDDTDGHIDGVARFVAPGVVAVATAPPDHPDHDALAAARDTLAGMTDAAGRLLKIVDLPMPEPLRTDDGEPLPASPANFLITDPCILLPAFGGPSDAAAKEALQSARPDRPVVLLDSRALVWGRGAIHCLSMPVPAV